MAASYAESSQRHARDAVHLAEVGRVENADHLAGFAVECGLKALLCGPGGVSVPDAGAPRHGGVAFGHLPGLWDDVALYFTGPLVRSVPGLASLLAQPNIFKQHSWSISDRYESDGYVGDARSEALLALTFRVQRLLSAAALNGVGLA
ncbi:MAG: hypothetical protein IT196_20565 [Acidimicrobiales bacterium]|nr:hypothetical protein [Acidimicrobiales bacterium]